MALLLHGLKSPRIFNENKRFLSKVIFIPQHSSLRGRYTWYSDFSTFRCPFCNTKCPSLRNTPRFSRRLPHSMWISFSGATAWGLGTDNSRWGPSLENTMREQPIRIVNQFGLRFQGRVWSWWYRTKAKVAPLKRM